NIGDLAIATLELGLGRYAEALAAVEPLLANQQPRSTCIALATAVEAAARATQPNRAARYLANLGNALPPPGQAGLWGRSHVAVHSWPTRPTPRTSISKRSHDSDRPRSPPSWRKRGSPTGSGSGARTDGSTRGYSSDPPMMRSPRWARRALPRVLA